MITLDGEIALLDVLDGDGSDAVRVASGGDKFWQYTQAVPEDVWTIIHPLKKYPSVTVVDSGGSVVIGDVAYVDNATITITFRAAFAGKAYLN